MRRWPAIGLGVAVAASAAAAGLYLQHRRGMRAAVEAWAAVARGTGQTAPRFSPEMVADQPETARRYFAHAIAPGTPLYTAVEVEMRGTFLLGDRARYSEYAMAARQILRPPHEFVWLPRFVSGPAVITGSDVLVDGKGWTRFWLNGLVPVANVASSADLVRSATFRAAVEGLWVPASFLPQNGVTWQQIGPDNARVTINRTTPPITLDLTLAADGAVKEVAGLRWSDANPDKRFKLQPFGGTVSAEATFGGVTIPSRLSVGNHYGTPDYLPFFQAEITRARYL